MVLNVIFSLLSNDQIQQDDTSEHLDNHTAITHMQVYTPPSPAQRLPRLHVPIFSDAHLHSSQCPVAQEKQAQVKEAMAISLPAFLNLKWL